MRLKASDALDLGVALVAAGLIIKGALERPIYHLRSELCGVVIADFWTTNKASMEEWRRFKPGRDNPYYLWALEQVRRATNGGVSAYQGGAQSSSEGQPEGTN